MSTLNDWDDVTDFEDFIDVSSLKLKNLLNGMKGKKPMKAKHFVRAIFGVGIVIIAILWGGLTETVNKGTYDIIQYPGTGTISAKMKPGMYPQLFGDFETWNVSETFYFTKDSEEGEDRDQSIPVRFNDGSECDVSGTCRVDMPTNGDHAKSLMTKDGYKSYDDLHHRLIYPIVRKALRSSANLMNAQESYATRREYYISSAWDQIENGVYKLVVVEREINDPDWIRPKDKDDNMNYKVKAPKIKKNFNEILKIDGVIQRDHNPLENTGITLSNFEVKKFFYSDKVNAQINKQQENLMAIDTSRAEASRAQQESKTRKAKGESQLMKVRYEELQKKEKATIQAKQEKEVAITKANQLLEVAILGKRTAKEDKDAKILAGEGIAKFNTLVMKSDGALDKKLANRLAVETVWAEAYKLRNVPTTYVEGNSGGGSNSVSGPDAEFARFMKLSNMRNIEELNVSTKIRNNN